MGWESNGKNDCRLGHRRTLKGDLGLALQMVWVRVNVLARSKGRADMLEMRFGVVEIQLGSSLRNAKGGDLGRFP